MTAISPQDFADMEDGRALRELRERCEASDPYRAWFLVEWTWPRSRTDEGGFEVRFEKHIGDGVTRFRGPTIAAAADKAREALR